MGVPTGVGGVQAVDVAEQKQQVRPHAPGHDGGQGVVLPDGGGHPHLVGGHRVVLVDHRQNPQLQQAVDGVLKILPPLGVVHVLRRQQQLGHSVAVGPEQLVVGVHQLTLAHSGGGLLGGHIRRTAGQVQFPHPHADGPGGHQHQLMPSIFQIRQHLHQLLHPADIQPPGGMGQGGGAHFYHNLHSPLLRLPWLGYYTTLKRKRKAPEMVCVLRLFCSAH